MATIKICSFGKDGGDESTVFGFWIVELKKLFTIVFLKFEGMSREAYHNHAFNSISWVISGMLIEEMLDGSTRIHTPSIIPIITPREDFHKVSSFGNTYVISFRGKWDDVWHEKINNDYIRLTHGRKIL